MPISRYACFPSLEVLVLTGIAYHKVELLDSISNIRSCCHDRGIVSLGLDGTAVCFVGIDKATDEHLCLRLVDVGPPKLKLAMEIYLLN